MGVETMTTLDPPFNEIVSRLTLLPCTRCTTSSDSASRADSVFSPHSSQLDGLLPASIRTENALELPSTTHLDGELNLKRLNKIYKYLWLAGRPMPPRPLHYQRAASRDIMVVEKMDLHLVWERNRMYLKPLPRYLLSHSFWMDNLICKPRCRCAPLATRSETDPLNSNPRSIGHSDMDICLEHQLYQCALGFLLSYVALIQYESDFRIAQSAFLLPESVTWVAWKELVRQLLHKKNHGNISNKRFLFGELRLDRLNMIYRFLFGYSRGYRFEYQTYGSFLQDNLAPIISFIAFLAIVLTAMQVGLAIDRLGKNEIFQRASYGFTVFSLLSPTVFITLILIRLPVFFIGNLFATLSFKKKRLADNHQSQSTV